MIKDYFNIFKNYFSVSHLKKKYFVYMLFVDIIYKAAQLLMIFFASWIIKYATLGDINMTWISLGLLFLSYVTYTLFNYIRYILYGKNMHYTFTTLQSLIFNKILMADDSFTEKISKGKLLNSVIDDPIEIGDNCNQVTEIITTIVQIIAVLIIASFYNIWLGIIMFVYVILHLKFTDYMLKCATSYYRKERRQYDKYSSLLSQVLSGLSEIKSFDMLGNLNYKLDEIQNKYTKVFMIKRSYITYGYNDVNFLVYFFRIVLYIVLLYMIMNDRATVDIIVLIVGYHESLITYINRLRNSFSSIRSTDVAALRINDIMNYKEKKYISYGLIETDDIDGSVEFRNVSFGYNQKEILKDISFMIKPNTITAIVGKSGTGKTSIINLLLRLYKPNDGEVLIDGLPVFDYTREVYSSNVAVVNQKPFVFNMSIRKNLSFVDSNISRQIEACKKVGIHDFISCLPSGYHTILRENASNISGGQKQLISLARTLLTGSEVLLLDEVTSSLDPESAKAVMDVLKELKKDHTIIMITHKPEVMRKADRIIVINDGKIVGDGKHCELIKNNEYYQWLQARKPVSKLGVFKND